MDLGYDPYEWFDPEVGRRARSLLVAAVYESLGNGKTTRARIKRELREDFGVSRLSLIPLEKLPIAFGKEPPP